MFGGYERLRRVKQILAAESLNGSCSVRGLTRAGQAFWSATFHYDEWPPELRRRAKQLQHRLLAKGMIDVTVSAMDAAERHRTAVLLRDFVAEFESTAAEASDTTSGGEVPKAE